MSHSANLTTDGFEWHAIDVDEALVQLDTSNEGLTPDEVTSRRAQWGPNRLPQATRRSELARFLGQFRNLLIYVLVGAGVLAAAIGHTVDAAVIMMVVLINATIGFVQEGRAARALDAIRAMIDPRASVIRAGRRLTVDAADIVPGDLVLIEAGDRVPADLRLVRARGLRIDESALTGESVPTDKRIDSVGTDTPLGSRQSMAFSGTLVTAGQGAGAAVATGSSSELGRISTLIGSVQALETPLVRQMNAFARAVTIVILGLSVVVFGFAMIVRGYPMPEAFMAVVGIAVAAIPEGLPAVMTIALAIGVQRMAQRHAIVRRLPAVETLGSVSIICSDKTGTLTRNEMTVRTLTMRDGAVEVTGTGYKPVGEFMRSGAMIEPLDDPGLSDLIHAVLLCNDANLRSSGDDWIVDGDPMEGALVSLAAKAGIEVDLARRQIPRSDEIPFDAVHRFMATLHHSHDGETYVIVKGAPERILEMSAYARGPARDDTIEHAYWHTQIDAMANQGQRVIAIGRKPLPSETRTLEFSDVDSGLILLGLVGLIDPPRQEAIAAVAECRTAGISVKMITGDHAATARAIAQQLGLGADPKVVLGQTLDGLQLEELKQVARDTAVFARTTPEHKLRLVEAMQANGDVVAMTGDGVNDAAALKRADVGVAMGDKGTEAAKEASEVVLADDNFASIVAAVREGRTVYDNLVKVISWTLPTNGGEALAIVLAILFGFTLPVTAVQILWINMITAVCLGLTLAFEPTEASTMRRPPRPRARGLLSGRLLWRVVFVSLCVVAGAFGMFFLALERGLSLEVARTIVVNTIVVMEIFYLFSVRYVHGTSLTLRGAIGTNAVLFGILIVTLGQLALTYAPPMQAIFGTASVGLLDGMSIIGVGIVFLLIVEVEKGLFRRKEPN